MDRDDLELFTRSLQHATEHHTGPELDAALDELGWHDALATDRQAAIAALFELQGRTNATSSAIGAVLVDGLGAPLASRHIVVPAPGASMAPGIIDGGHLVIRGVATTVVLNSASVIVVAPDGPGHIATEIPTDTLTLRPLAGLDTDLGLVAVDGRVPVGDTHPADWEAACRLARLAISHELLGASRTMLDMARQHALERIQFGTAIVGFQAVRHRLAETLVAIETAEAMLDAAWDDGDPLSAAMAKAIAGKSARTTARHSQQVLAGIGFTLEHRFHHSFRRVLVLDELFGSARQLTKHLGRQLIETRRLPPVPHL